MSKKTVGSYVGPSVIDASAVMSALVDIPEGDLQGYRRSKPGLADVLDELGKVMPAHGDAARIHPKIYEEITDAASLLQTIKALRLNADKLAEVMHESQVYYEDKLETALSKLAKVVETTAKDDEMAGLLAMFDKTLQYRSQYAEKAMATKRRKENAEAETGKETGSGT